MLIVQKFGGSSLADTEKLRHAAEKCRDSIRHGNETVLVVSAMGDTTDELEKLAHSISSTPPAREMDALLTTGEQQSAALTAIMLESIGVPAHSFSGWQAGVFTDKRHGDADIAVMAPGRIREALRQGLVPVVSGFQGLSPAGDITALGRGGSDTTAAALAAALGADRCEIYTDVDGIYTADPRLIAGAKKLERIDYRDMLRLARAGSQVLHPKSVELALLERVELRVLGTFAEGNGSTVCSLREEERPPFVGVTRDAARRELTLVGRAAGADALSALVLTLADRGIQVLSGSVSDGSVTVKVSPAQLSAALDAAHALIVS